MPSIARYAPGLAALLRYRLADAPADLKAGLAVASVAVPVGIAYAELAGFRPEVGLYSSILPLVAYAIFPSLDVTDAMPKRTAHVTTWTLTRRSLRLEAEEI